MVGQEPWIPPSLPLCHGRLCCQVEMLAKAAARLKQGWLKPWLTLTKMHGRGWLITTTASHNCNLSLASNTNELHPYTLDSNIKHKHAPPYSSASNFRRYLKPTYIQRVCVLLSEVGRSLRLHNYGPMHLLNHKQRPSSPSVLSHLPPLSTAEF